MADSVNLHKSVYDGLGGAHNPSTALPPQAIPEYKKNKKWEKSCMDRLEEIGLSQIRKNLVYNEYYEMVEGNLAYTDYVETPEILKGVVDIRDRADIPSYVRHFDIIGQLGRHLGGKYNDVKGKFRVDFFDPIAVNEYDREINNQLFDFSKNLFNIELKRRLAAAGISMQDEFETEEEQQQYMQYLEEQKSKLSTPPEIKSAMDTQWKPIAAKWAEHTLEIDKQRFQLDRLDAKLFMDKYLTGRFFKHYRLGYDYYKPERWNPIQTFFSEDLDIEYPQDGEYVGNIRDLSPSQIVDEFGHLLTEKQQKEMLNAFDYESVDHNSSPREGMTFESILEKNMSEPEELIPHDDYWDRQSNLELQNALNQPFGEITYNNSEGEVVKRPRWIPNYEFNSTGVRSYSQMIRRDIDVRTDTIRVTQAYWRSYKRIGVIYYETEIGIPATEWVTEDILEEFLTENNITKLKNVTLAEFENKLENGTLEPNSIMFTYAPIVYKGTKLSAEHTILKKDLYLGVEPLPLQIKGDSNIYDVKLPVSGYIGLSEAAKLRPYQIEYNYQMNLMHSLTEKEIGIFWLFDISMLPSDFEGMGDARETLLNVTEMARDVGLVPIDMSKQNMRDRVGQQFNSMMSQDISFVPQIQQKMQLAEYFKGLALEQIGITKQDLGTPSEYATAEGIKVGQFNSLAQIEHIFEAMDSARLKDMEINLAVAQYAQKNDKDISVAYTRSSEEQNLIRIPPFSDPDFHLRKFGLLPIADSKKRKELEQFKQFLLNSNTFENDLSDVAQVVSSDSFQVVGSLLKKSQAERREIEEQRQQREMQMQQQEIQAEQQKTQSERTYQLEKQKREHANAIKVANIQATAKVKDRNEEEGDVEDVNKIADRYLKEKTEGRKLDLKEADQKEKARLATMKLKKDMEELEVKKEANRIKKDAIKAKMFGDVVNKN